VPYFHGRVAVLTLLYVGLGVFVAVSWAVARTGGVCLP